MSEHRTGARPPGGSPPPPEDGSPPPPEGGSLPPPEGGSLPLPEDGSLPLPEDGSRPLAGGSVPPPDPGARPQFLDPARPLARELELGITDGFTLAAVGDCVISRPLSRYLRDPGFAAVMEQVTAADVRFGNLETVIADIGTFRGYPQAPGADWALLGGPGVAADLASLGFQLLSRANNHALDWGIEGMRETSRWLNSAGIVHAGTGEHRGLARAPSYLETPHGRVGLVSFTSSFGPAADALAPRDAAPGRPGVSALRVSSIEQVPQPLFDMLRALPPAEPAGGRAPGGLAPGLAGRPDDGRITRFGVTFEAAPALGRSFCMDRLDVAEILRAIRQAKQHSDFVVAAIHTHQAPNEHEFGTAILRPAGFLAPLARAAIDAGASAFVTTGHHNVGPAEVYRGRPILYGLGNFFWSDLQEPLPEDLYRQPAHRVLAARAFSHPERMTDADLTALLNAAGGFANRFTFQSCLAVCTFRPAGLADFRLYPVTLRYGERLTWSGLPDVPEPAEAAAILDDIRACSQPLGTTITTVTDDGRWVYGRVIINGEGQVS